MREQHWEAVWAARAVNAVSWFQLEPEPSLGLVRGVAGPADPVIDVGGGASRLADALLDAGFEALTVLDISGRALRHLQERLGPRAARVRWIVGDVLETELGEATYALWHDRAVFHFLLEDEERARYAERVRAAVRPGGHAVVGTFALDGPERCSGLPVRRQDPALIRAAFGEGWTAAAEVRHVHVTPAGRAQPFTFVVLRRARAADLPG